MYYDFVLTAHCGFREDWRRIPMRQAEKEAPKEQEKSVRKAEIFTCVVCEYLLHSSDILFCLILLCYVMLCHVV